MEKGVDTRTLSTEAFENCGNFWIVEILKNLFLEISIISKTCPRRDNNFFHVWQKSDLYSEVALAKNIENYLQKKQLYDSANISTMNA